MISGVAVALPALGGDLGAGATALSLVETLFLAAAVALLLPFGRLGDAADKATLYKLGMAAFALSCLAIGFVSSVAAILALRVLQGACSAAVQAAGPALIADAVPPERRGRAYGVTIGAVYAGLTLGPIFAGFLVELWGWRAVFLAGGAVVLVLLAPIHFMLPAIWRRPAPRAVHLPSTALVSAAMLALVGGAATAREGAIGYGAMALGLALLAAFLFLQRRVAQPLLNVELLARNRVLRNALLVQCLLYLNAVPPERTGIAAALTATARSLGMVSGMLIVAALVSANLGHAPVEADPARFVTTMQLSFWILAALTAAALVLSLVGTGASKPRGS